MGIQGLLLLSAATAIESTAAERMPARAYRPWFFVQPLVVYEGTIVRLSWRQVFANPYNYWTYIVDPFSEVHLACQTTAQAAHETVQDFWITPIERWAIPRSKVSPRHYVDTNMVIGPILNMRDETCQFFFVSPSVGGYAPFVSAQALTLRFFSPYVPVQAHLALVS